MCFFFELFLIFSHGIRDWAQSPSQINFKLIFISYINFVLKEKIKSKIIIVSKKIKLK